MTRSRSCPLLSAPSTLNLPARGTTLVEDPDEEIFLLYTNKQLSLVDRSRQPAPPPRGPHPSRRCGARGGPGDGDRDGDGGGGGLGFHSDRGDVLNVSLRVDNPWWTTRPLSAPSTSPHESRTAAFEPGTIRPTVLPEPLDGKPPKRSSTRRTDRAKGRGNRVAEATTTTTTPTTTATATGGRKGNKGKDRVSDGFEIQVEVHQSLNDLRNRKGDTGSVVWNLSLHLATFLLKSYHFPRPPSRARDRPLLPRLSSSTVLELGSGTGFLGVALRSVFAGPGTRDEVGPGRASRSSLRPTPATTVGSSRSRSTTIPLPRDSGSRRDSPSKTTTTTTTPLSIDRRDGLGGARDGADKRGKWIFSDQLENLALVVRTLRANGIGLSSAEKERKTKGGGGGGGGGGGSRAVQGGNPSSGRATRNTAEPVRSARDEDEDEDEDDNFRYDVVEVDWVVESREFERSKENRQPAPRRSPPSASPRLTSPSLADRSVHSAAVRTQDRDEGDDLRGGREATIDPDVIVAVDCIYNPSLCLPLVHTILSFARVGSSTSRTTTRSEDDEEGTPTTDSTVVVVAAELRDSEPLEVFLRAWQDEARAIGQRWMIVRVGSRSERADDEEDHLEDQDEPGNQEARERERDNDREARERLWGALGDSKYVVWIGWRVE
ncbi:hypothetical protein JCM10212_003397 [Sporobolomyces blumeae]